jgi:hypothetical protein
MKKFVFFSLLILFSCKKENRNIHVSGTVIDGLTGSPLSNVKVKLVDYSSALEITTAISDANGKFRIESGKSKAYQYGITTEYLNYYTNGSLDFNLPLDENEENNNLVLSLYPTVYLKIRGIKTDTTFERIGLITQIGKYGQLGLEMTTALPIDSIYLKTKGGLSNTVYFNVHKYPTVSYTTYIQSEENYTIYCEPTDTTTLNITY